MSKKVLEILESLPEGMKNNILARKGRTGKLSGTSIKRIPSIDDFKLGEKTINEALLLVGIDRKMREPHSFTVNKFDRCNKYMKWQIKRAKLCLRNGNINGFGMIARKSMKYSVSFRISACYHVMPHGYYNISIHNMDKLLKKINRIISNEDASLEFYRVYINKANGKLRPLGVPLPEGRVVMYMGNCGLVEFIREDIVEFNHAYLPERGTLTAGKDIILKVLNKKNIYEFDLKSFFDNVSVSEVTELLDEKGMPIADFVYLDEINMRTPSNLEEVLESEVKKKGEINQGIGRNYEDLLFNLDPNKDGSDAKGLPQGLNTSPILSLLTLKKGYLQLKKEGTNLLMYADDGLIYSNDSISTDNPKFNPKKSKGLKKDGQGQVDKFTFLGLNYDTRTQLLSGNTRNGSTLEFDTVRKGLFDLLRYLNKCDLKYPGNLEILAKSSIFGTVQSRLYSNTGESRLGPEKPGEIKENSLFFHLGYKQKNLLSGPLSIYFLAPLVGKSMGKPTNKRLIREIITK